MTVSFDLLLPVGALAFYLYDSAHLLYGNELLMIRRGGQWEAQAASSLRLFGRRVAVPNPLLPGALVFKVQWSETDARPLVDETVAIDDFEDALRGLKPLVLALLVLLACALPVTSIGFGAGAALLGVFVAYYGLVLVALLVVYRRRVALGVPGKAFWMLAIDVFACAPFAVNLVRKLALHRGLRGNPLRFASREFAPAALARLRLAIAAAIEPDLAHATPGSPQRAALEAMLAVLEPAPPSAEAR